MKISDEIYSQIIDFINRNVYFVPSALVKGEYVKVCIRPSRIYLGRKEIIAIFQDPDCFNYYRMELNPKSEKRDTVFNLELYTIAEDSHIFVA